MKELFRICNGEHKHRFNATEGFRHVDVCPFEKCKHPMDLVEIDYVSPNLSTINGVTRASEAYGKFRGSEIDKWPRLPWYADAVSINNTDRDRSRETWTLKEALELSARYNECGIADHITWDVIAKGMGRSLYAIERQLRIIIAYEDKELGKYFPDI